MAHTYQAYPLFSWKIILGGTLLRFVTETWKDKSFVRVRSTGITCKDATFVGVLQFCAKKVIIHKVKDNIITLVFEIMQEAKEIVLLVSYTS